MHLETLKQVLNGQLLVYLPTFRTQDIQEVLIESCRDQI